jgi:aldehyde dehydrogenase (NAD+)
MLERVRTSAKPTWFDSDKCFINGRWVEPQSGRRLPVEDPSRGVEIGEIARGESGDIDTAVEAAERALAGGWGRLTATERGRLMAKLAELIKERVDELAHIEALDVGKPLKQGRADALAMARYMEFYGGAADKVMGETIPYLDGYTVYTLREPHGVTGHIVPWNYPMQIAGRTVGAALAMGNACVLKPAEEACLTSLALADLAREAGFPAGALNVVPGLGEEAGAALAAHPGVRHLSFTGSVAVGALVQEAAARHVAPVTLELGGKSPQLVFADADLERALPFLVNAGIQNAGRTCSASSRILVERKIYGEVVERMAARYRTLKVGPADADLDVGPLISERQKSIVSRFISEGADLKTAATAQIVENAPRVDIISPRPCSRMSAQRIAWRRRKSSAPSRSSFPSMTKSRRRRSPMGPATVWLPVSGRPTGGGRCGSPRRCARAKCSSTITARAAALSCHSEAWANRVTAAKRDSRRCTVSRH